MLSDTLRSHEAAPCSVPRPSPRPSLFMISSHLQGGLMTSTSYPQPRPIPRHSRPITWLKSPSWTRCRRLRFAPLPPSVSMEAHNRQKVELKPKNLFASGDEDGHFPDSSDFHPPHSRRTGFIVVGNLRVVSFSKIRGYYRWRIQIEKGSERGSQKSPPSLFKIKVRLAKLAKPCSTTTAIAPFLSVLPQKSLHVNKTSEDHTPSAASMIEVSSQFLSSIHGPHPLPQDFQSPAYFVTILPVGISLRTAKRGRGDVR
jgi:hypothetical protein